VRDNAVCLAAGSLYYDDNWYDHGEQKVFKGKRGVLGAMAGMADSASGSLLSAVVEAVTDATTPSSAAT